MPENRFEHLGLHARLDSTGGEGVAENVGRYPLEGVTVLLNFLDDFVNLRLDPVSAQGLALLRAEKISVGALRAEAPIPTLLRYEPERVRSEGNIPPGGHSFRGVLEIAASVDVFEGALDVDDVLAPVNIRKLQPPKLAVSHTRAQHHGEEIIEIAFFRVLHKERLLLLGERLAGLALGLAGELRELHGISLNHSVAGCLLETAVQEDGHYFNRRKGVARLGEVVIELLDVVAAYG